jgi:hypothetical protein
MEQAITHLVINWIDFDENVITVGATDNERWRWDIEDGMSGADAFTFVYVSIADNGEGYTPTESAGFHCSMVDPLRPFATAHLMELFEIAWRIRKENLTIPEAREKFFGKAIYK